MAYSDEALGISPVSAQSLNGSYSAVTATGSSLANSTALTTNGSLMVVGGADGTKGVTLPQAMVGDEVWIFNNSGSTLKVWPGNSSTAIAVVGTGLGTGGTAFSQLTYKTTLYKMLTSTQWLAITSA